MTPDERAALREKSRLTIHGFEHGQAAPIEAYKWARAFLDADDERARLGERAYPHMCRDGHPQIGWRGEGEMCPVCVERGRVGAAELARVEAQARVGLLEGALSNLLRFSPSHAVAIAAARAALAQRPAQEGS